MGSVTTRGPEPDPERVAAIAAVLRTVQIANLLVYGIIGVMAALSAISVAPDVRLLGLVGLAIAPFALEAAGVRLPPVLVVAVSFGAVGAVIGLGGAKLAMLIPIAVAGWVALRSASLPLNVLAMLGVLGLSALLEYGGAAEQVAGGHLDAGSVIWVAAALYGAATGYLLRRTRELAFQLAAAQHRLATVAAADERRRVAQDVHDLVAHSLAVVLLNISGARRAMGRDPLAADEALARAEAVGRESINGVRQAVGLLREAGGSSASGSGPLPDAHDLDALVEGYRRGGLPVRLRVTGDLDDVGPVAGSVLFRTARESLANVSRHAPGMPARVDVTIGADAVRVAVDNDLPSTGRVGTGLGRTSEPTGLGLTGMAERVRALGGEFAAGAVGDQWRLSASIPLGLGITPPAAGGPDTEPVPDGDSRISDPRRESGA